MELKEAKQNPFMPDFPDLTCEQRKTQEAMVDAILTAKIDGDALGLGVDHQCCEFHL